MSPCGLSGFLWDVVFLYVLWGILMLDVSRGHVNGKFMTVLYAAVKVFVCIVGFVFWIIGTEKSAIVLLYSALMSSHFLFGPCSLGPQ